MILLHDPKWKCESGIKLNSLEVKLEQLRIAGNGCDYRVSRITILILRTITKINWKRKSNLRDLSEVSEIYQGSRVRYPFKPGRFKCTPKVYTPSLCIEPWSLNRRSPA